MNMVVFAGPGSGKTAVLTGHVVNQLKKETLSPQQMMVMTFTKQAARELKIRLSRALSPSVNLESLRLGTFHGLMFSLLLQETPDIPVLLGDDEQRMLLEMAAAESGVRGQREIRALQAEMTFARSSWPTRPVRRPYKKAANRYENLKVRHHRWDFDDILLEVCRLCESGASLHTHPPDYILMDEFQDTNHVQWYILNRFISRYGTRLFVVGDDDQSIYGFRGARPEWLLHFAESVPGAKRHLLTTNFRSDMAIVRHAGRLISHNHERVQKRFEVFSREEGDIQQYVYSDEEQQDVAVIQFLEVERQSHPNWSIALLARTRRQLYRVWSRLGAVDRAYVQCRTFHDAKGKEWDIVHILDAVAWNPYLPNHLDRVRSDEEERRLFYVAMTRAKHRLVMHVPRVVAGQKTNCSPYVSESGVSLYGYQ